MRFSLRYYVKEEIVFIPDENLLEVLTPQQFMTPFVDIVRSIDEAVKQTVEFLKGSVRTLVLINDYTRPTCNEAILKPLLPELTKRDTKYMICLGSHRKAKEEELKRILGQDVYEEIKDKIVQHNAYEPAQLVFLGKTGFGTEVELNRELLWADRIIAINSVEPHYFAGYTGGRKSFLPGIAGIKTITNNHNLLLHPASAPFSLKDNPVHRDMNEAARMVSKPIFSFQLIQNPQHNLLAIRYGDLFSSFEQACIDAYRVYAVPVEKRADIILSVLQHPYDINFYQSQRAVEFALSALKPGGIQITVSACYDGVGNDEFISMLSKCESLNELTDGKPQDIPGWYKSARLARIMQNYHLFTVMPGVKDEIIKSVFMHPFSSAQSALAAALSQLGKNATVYIIPDAGSLIPIVH